MMENIEDRWIQANVWAYNNAQRISQAAIVDNNKHARTILIIAALGVRLREHGRNQVFIEQVEALRKEWGE